MLVHHCAIARNRDEKPQRQRRAQPAGDRRPVQQRDRGEAGKRERRGECEGADDHHVKRACLRQRCVQTSTPAEGLRHDIATRAGKYRRGERRRCQQSNCKQSGRPSSREGLQSDGGVGCAQHTRVTFPERRCGRNQDKEETDRRSERAPRRVGTQRVHLSVGSPPFRDLDLLPVIHIARQRRAEKRQCARCDDRREREVRKDQ